MTYQRRYTLKINGLLTSCIATLVISIGLLISTNQAFATEISQEKQTFIPAKYENSILGRSALEIFDLSKDQISSKHGASVAIPITIDYILYIESHKSMNNGYCMHLRYRDNEYDIMRINLDSEFKILKISPISEAKTSIALKDLKDLPGFQKLRQYLETPIWDTLEHACLEQIDTDNTVDILGKTTLEVFCLPKDTLLNKHDTNKRIYLGNGYTLHIISHWLIKDGYYMFLRHRNHEYDIMRINLDSEFKIMKISPTSEAKISISLRDLKDLPDFQKLKQYL